MTALSCTYHAYWLDKKAFKFHSVLITNPVNQSLSNLMFSFTLFILCIGLEENHKHSFIFTRLYHWCDIQTFTQEHLMLVLIWHLSSYIFLSLSEGKLATAWRCPTASTEKVSSGSLSPRILEATGSHVVWQVSQVRISVYSAYLLG